MEEEIVRELSKEYKRRQKIIKIMIDICLKYEYNFEEAKNMIEQFYKS